MGMTSRCCAWAGRVCPTAPLSPGGRGARAAEQCHWVGPRAARMSCSCPLWLEAAFHSHRRRVRSSWQPSLECSHDMSPLSVAPSHGYEQSFLCLDLLSPVSLLGRQTAPALAALGDVFAGSNVPSVRTLCLGAAASLRPRLHASAPPVGVGRPVPRPGGLTEGTTRRLRRGLSTRSALRAPRGRRANTARRRSTVPAWPRRGPRPRAGPACGSVFSVFLCPAQELLKKGPLFASSPTPGQAGQDTAMREPGRKRVSCQITIT